MLEYIYYIDNSLEFQNMGNKGHNVRKGKKGFQPIRKTPLEAPKAGNNAYNIIPCFKTK